MDRQVCDSQAHVNTPILLHVQDTRFIRDVIDKAIFSLGGMHKRGELTFSEFVCATVIYCSYSKDQLLYKIFQVFDLDESGYLSMDE